MSKQLAIGIGNLKKSVGFVFLAKLLQWLQKLLDLPDQTENKNKHPACKIETKIVGRKTNPTEAIAIKSNIARVH